MDKDASLFSLLDEAKERKIYVVVYFSLDVVGQSCSNAHSKSLKRKKEEESVTV
jgi:hypothetical protein